MFDFIKANWKSLRTLELAHFCGLLLLAGLPISAHYHVESLYTPFSAAISSLLLYVAGKSALERKDIKNT